MDFDYSFTSNSFEWRLGIINTIGDAVSLVSTSKMVGELRILLLLVFQNLLFDWGKH